MSLLPASLDGVTSIPPDTPLFLYMYVRKEALLSSQIEGTQSSLSDLLLFEIEEAPGATKPIISIPDAAAKLGLSSPTVSKSIQHLEQLGLLREITGKQRRRLFVYAAYLSILSQGTEPLPR